MLEVRRLVQFHQRCPKCGTEHIIPEHTCDSIVAATGARVEAQHHLLDLDIDNERLRAELNAARDSVASLEARAKQAESRASEADRRAILLKQELADIHYVASVSARIEWTKAGIQSWEALSVPGATRMRAEATTWKELACKLRRLELRVVGDG